MNNIKQTPMHFEMWVPEPARVALQRFYGRRLPCEPGVAPLQDVVMRLATRPEMKEAWAKLQAIGLMQPDTFVEDVVAARFAANVRLIWKNKWEGYCDFGHKRKTKKINASIAKLEAAPRFPRGKDMTNRCIEDLKELAAFHQARSRTWQKVFATIPPIGKVYYSGDGYPRKPMQRAFVRTLAYLLKWDTGQPRYRLVATITNVVFDADLGAREAARWCARLQGEDSGQTRPEKY